MPTLILRPNANGHQNLMTPVGDAPNYKCVDDVVADDDATYIEMPGGVTKINYIDASTPDINEVYNIQNHTAETGTINSITLYYRAYHYDPVPMGLLIECGFFIMQSPSTYDMVYLDRNDIGLNTWVTVSHTWNQNPWTSTAWTWDDIDILQISFYAFIMMPPPIENMYYTQVYLEVDYEEPPEVHPIGSHKSSQESIYNHKSSQENIYKFKTVT